MEILRGRNSEVMIAWAIVLILLAGCVFVMRPFISALLWALVLSFASWPVYQRLLRLVGNRRSLAALLMTLAMVVTMLVPVLIVASTMAQNVRDLAAAVQRWLDAGPPAPPGWLAKVPIVGHRAVDSWQTLAQDSTKFWAAADRLVEPVSSLLLKVGLGVGRGFLQIALSLLITFFLFRDAGRGAERLSCAVERLSGQRGRHLLTIAGNTVRGVVYGILGTGLLQAVLLGIGYLISGLPGAGLLALITFFVSILPLLGTGLVWIPAAIWLFHQGSTGWGIFMLAWGLVVSSMDNFVRPWLISQGSELPFLLIFFGVIGGAFTFGFIGVFLGPTLLAVGYRLVQEWISSHSDPMLRPVAEQAHSE